MRTNRIESNKIAGDFKAPGLIEDAGLVFIGVQKIVNLEMGGIGRHLAFRFNADLPAFPLEFDSVFNQDGGGEGLALNQRVCLFLDMLMFKMMIGLAYTAVILYQLQFRFPTAAVNVLCATAAQPTQPVWALGEGTFGRGECG